MRLWKILILFLFIIGCNDSYTPKPRGYFRIEFPEKEYARINDQFPYSFEIPNYSIVQKVTHNETEDNWINIAIEENNVEIHISYYDLETQNKQQKNVLIELMEDTRKLAYKHSIKANAIDEQIFTNNKQKVYGTIYNIKGNAASPMQFFLTDSTKHFLRGAFYIREVPDMDSLKPVIDFIEPDIIRLIETTSWN